MIGTLLLDQQVLTVHRPFQTYTMPTAMGIDRLVPSNVFSQGPDWVLLLALQVTDGED